MNRMIRMLNPMMFFNFQTEMLGATEISQKQSSSCKMLLDFEIMEEASYQTCNFSNEKSCYETDREMQITLQEIEIEIIEELGIYILFPQIKSYGIKNNESLAKEIMVEYFYLQEDSDSLQKSQTLFSLREILMSFEDSRSSNRLSF